RPVPNFSSAFGARDAVALTNFRTASVSTASSERYDDPISPGLFDAPGELLTPHSMLPVITGLLWGCAFVQAGGQAATAAPSGIIRMDVRLVVFHATVLDAAGNAVSGLGLPAFHLFVD